MQPEDLFNAPIPGQSLTQDPNSRGPWEMPPKFNSVNAATDHLFKTIMSPSFIDALSTIASEDKKFYVDELVAAILSEGFLNGLWTVDAMLLLVDPLTAMLVWAYSHLDASPTFSTDTGYEDRTGFEDLVSEALGDTDTPTAPTATQEIPEDPQETQGPTGAQSPLTSNVPQSPLTGGL